jgi:hypothetical protein
MPNFNNIIRFISVWLAGQLNSYCHLKKTLDTVRKKSEKNVTLCPVHKCL